MGGEGVCGRVEWMEWQREMGTYSGVGGEEGGNRREVAWGYVNFPLVPPTKPGPLAVVRGGDRSGYF